MKIKIRVKADSKEQCVEKKENYYFVKLKSVAKEGKANDELLKLLKKYFKRDVKIKSGLRSRDKVVELED